MSTNNRSFGQQKHLHLIKSEQDCKKCGGERLCLTFGLCTEAIQGFKGIIKERGPIAIDEYVYRQQAQFKSLFLIQSGSIKTQTVTAEGRLSVMGFYLPGDLFGIDAIGDNTYLNDAIAMETTWVCELPYEALLKLCCGKPKLQEKFIALLGNKIHHDEYDGKVVRNESACRRVMHFLHQLYWHQAHIKAPSPRLHIPMSKQDIASYLGLTPESFSRTLTQLQKLNYIHKESHKELHLLQEPASENDVKISLFKF